MPTSSNRPTPSALRALSEEGAIGADTLDRALVLIGATPDPAGWRQAIERTLLWLGTLLVLAGVVVFFAYNWADLAPRYKFALIEAGIVGSLAVAWWQWRRPIGEAAAVAATVLLGVLLAVYGQVYPTGAPWYHLFGLWVLLALGWTLAGRYPAAWLLTVGLLAATWASFVLEMLPGNDEPLASAGVVAIGGGALAVWEGGARRWALLRPRWAPRLLGAATLTGGTMAALEAIFDAFSRGGTQFLPPILWLLLASGMVWYYRRHLPDLVMIAAVLLAAIALGAATIVRVGDASFWSFLLAGVAVLAASAAAATWLRRQGAGGDEG
jgi:uncharacterized membrane protein